MGTAVWWIRRDLRLHDNDAATAAARHEWTVPVFVCDPTILESPYVGARRTAFLFEGLRRLDSALQSRGSRLVVRQGEPARELADLCAEVGADVVYATADYSPYARERDASVEHAVPAIQYLGGPTVRHPSEVLKADGGPYSVFSPYKRKWRSIPLDVGEALPAPAELRTPSEPASVPLVDSPAWASSESFQPGETEARRRLEEFSCGSHAAMSVYDEQRDQLDVSGTSMMSPYLRFGMVSAQEAVRAARQAGALAGAGAPSAGAEAWLDELIWREFFVAILYHFPTVLEESFRENTRRLEWREDEAGFQAWCEGRTGYPVVDAAMRQLASHGWIHNRARMIAASFLVKDLLIDWRRGERYFRNQLLDGDPAANNGNWQWVAGTGTDAAPYFRIFNPTLQGKKHDPQGAWVRTWLPELAAVPDTHVHEPWKMDAEAQSRAGCVVGRDYPQPIIDHARARARTLAAYGAARDAAASD